MALQPTRFPVRSQTMKPVTTRKVSEPPKINAKGGPLVHRETRVFGTARNPNIPLKTKPVLEKPAKPKPKPASGLLKKPTKVTKPSQPTRSTILRQPIFGAGKPSERTPARLMKKTVCFQEKGIERNRKNLDDENAAEFHTPLNAIIVKPRVATPYHSAEKCSKCRFDKLETASYWLSQIKLAESVGKHSVSAAFFGLAFNCNAEPIRNLRVELKKYLARHEHVGEGEEWRKMSFSYGLVKEESRANGEVIEGGLGRGDASVHNLKDDDLQN